MEATTQRVGKFEFSVAVCEAESGAEDLQSRRQQALTAWLLSQWDRERAGHNESLAAIAERN